METIAFIIVALLAFFVFLSPQLIMIKLLTNDRKDIYAHAAEGGCDPEKTNYLLRLNLNLQKCAVGGAALKNLLLVSLFFGSLEITFWFDLAITFLTAAAGLFYIIKRKQATNKIDCIRFFAFVMITAAAALSVTMEMNSYDSVDIVRIFKSEPQHVSCLPPDDSSYGSYEDGHF